MLLLYTTFKYCSIKDRSLGLYYYIGIGAVILYTILTIFINKGYLQIDSQPHGSVTLISGKGTCFKLNPLSLDKFKTPHLIN